MVGDERVEQGRVERGGDASGADGREYASRWGGGARIDTDAREG